MRPSGIAIGGIAIRWTFGTSCSGADDPNMGVGPAEHMTTEPIRAEDAARPLTWSEAETMEILEDAALMKALAESEADMRAGRVSVWKPADA